MRLKLLLLILFTLPLLLGCGLKLPPLPPEPPKPPPVVEPPPIVEPSLPSPICAIGQTYGCYHNPGEGWLYACPVYDAVGGIIGVLNVTDPSTCPKKPEPPPVTPPPISSAPLIADEDLQLVPGDVRKLTWGLTSAAVGRWRSFHPEAWRADGACLVNGPAGIDAAFQGVANELLRTGVVAGQSIDKDGKRSDCIFVNRPATDPKVISYEYEETHLFDYSRGCVATGSSAIKHMYVRGAVEPVSPPPVTPPPSTTCTIPLNGTAQLTVYFLQPRILDFTPKILNASRCALPAVDYAGRQSCPVCNEGCAQRSACEQSLIGGKRISYSIESPTLKAYDEGSWKARIAGVGEGDFTACYPNGQVCAKFHIICTADTGCHKE